MRFARVTASMAESYSWVWLGDDAVEIPIRKDGESAADFKARAEVFAKEFQDAIDSNQIDKVPVKEGAKPVVFQLRHLTGRSAKMARDAVMAAQHANNVDFESRQAAAVIARMVVVDVENAYFEDGEPFRVSHVVDPETRLRILDDESFEVLCGLADGDLVNAIGFAAYGRLAIKKK